MKTYNSSEIENRFLISEDRYCISTHDNFNQALSRFSVAKATSLLPSACSSYLTKSLQHF